MCSYESGAELKDQANGLVAEAQAATIDATTSINKSPLV